MSRDLGCGVVLGLVVCGWLVIAVAAIAAVSVWPIVFGVVAAVILFALWVWWER